MKRMCRIWAVFAVAMLLLMSFSGAVFGATTKKLSSVTLHVKSKLESGDSLEKDSITEGEPADGELGIWVDSDKYEIDEMRITSGTSKDTRVGQEITVRVVLVTKDDDYIFKSGFSKKSVKISGGGGTVSSVSRSSHKLTVTLKIRAVKGQYEAPDDAEWRDSSSHPGKAHWTAASHGSGYYEVILRRGGSVIKRLNDYNGTSYDFYPYMTKTGTYTFRVRTVPHTSSQKQYGKNSDWAESDDLVIDKDHVSDGVGAVWDTETGAAYGSSGSSGAQPGGSGPVPGQAGWYQQNYRWFYRFPDGTVKSNGWEQIQGVWYCFEENGAMRTGWYRTDRGWYYFTDKGAMATGWADIGGTWYYFYEADRPDMIGLMAANDIVTRDGKTWYVDQDGKRASGWKQVGDHWSYFYPDSGEMARNTVIDTFQIDAEGCWRR